MKAGVRAELVEQALAKRLKTQVSVSVAGSYRELGRELDRETADLAWAPPALCAQAVPRARAILRTVRRGSDSYRSALVVRHDAPLDLARLKGHRAAWVDPMSTSGYLLPRSYLRAQGLVPQELFAEESCFGSYRDAALAVASGEADLCAVFAQQASDEAVMRTLTDLVGAIADRLRPIAFTERSPSDGLVLTRRPPRSVTERLLELLLDRPPPILLEACDASHFAMAAPDDYLALAQGQ